MKKLALIVACVALSASAFAQGTVNFNNRISGSVDAPIVNILTGLKIDGTLSPDVRAQLYGIGSGAFTDEGSLVAVADAPVGFRSGVAAGYVLVGSAGERTIAGTTTGGTAFIQVRAWSGGFATYELAYEAALLDNSILVGVSEVLQVTGLGGPVPGNPNATPPNLVGLQGFSIAPVPEPSTIALGVLGAGSLLFLRRKK